MFTKIQTKTWFDGRMMALAATFLFGTYSIFNKVLLEKFSPLTLAAISQAFSVMAVVLVFGAIPAIRQIQKVSMAAVAAAIVVGVLGSVAGPMLFLEGLKNTTATNAVLLVETDAIFTGFISALWLQERVTLNQVAGTILMIAGLYYIFTDGLTLTTAFRPGDILILLAALSFGATTAIYKKYLEKSPPELMIVISNLMGALLLFFAAPYLFNISHDFSAIKEKEAFRMLIFYSVVGIAIARFLWFKCLNRISATQASMISLLSPIFGLILAVIILRENLYFYHMVGGAVVIVGMALTVFHQQTQRGGETHPRIRHR